MNKNLKFQEDQINWMIAIFIILAIALRLYLLYFPIFFFGYLVPPGDDAVRHYEMIKSILSGNFNTDYPWLFHLFVAGIAKISGFNVIDILKFLAPALVVLPSIAIYIFLRRSFGRMSALIGFVIALWASNYALVAYGDGNYPNIIAGGLFLPLTLLFLLLSFRQRRLSYYLLTAIFAVLTLLTHHLSAVYLLVITLVYLIVLGAWNKFETIASNYRRTAVFILILLGAAILLVLASPFRSMFAEVFHSIAQSGSFSAGTSFSLPPEFSEYASQIGPFVYYGGLVGMIFLIYLLGQPKTRINKPALLLILVWFIVAYGFSRFSQVGLPGRFARETAVPLIMAEAIMVWCFIQAMQTNAQKIVAALGFGLIIILELVQVNGGAYRSPDFFKRMIWFDANDKRSADTIELIVPQDEVVLANPTTPYLPIFTSRKIVFVSLDKTPNLSALRAYAKAVEAHYVFIGTKTSANPDEETYPFFNNFDKISKNLQNDLSKCESITVPDSNFAIYDLANCLNQKSKISQ